MGMPHLIKNQFVIESDVSKSAQVPVTISNVMEGSPAELAQLKENDIVTKVQVVDGSDETFVVATDDLLNFNEKHAGEDIYLTFVRDGNISTVAVKLNDKDSKYQLGAGITGSAIYRSTWSAPIVALGTTVQLTGETFKGLGVMLWNLIDGGVKQIVGSEEAKEQGAERVADSSTRWWTLVDDFDRAIKEKALVEGDRGEGCGALIYCNFDFSANNHGARYI